MPQKKAPFWFGGSASCMGAVFTHPLDLVKVRLQTAGKGASVGAAKTALNIIKGEGFLAIYSGLSASLLRQGTYSTTRFGVYDALKNYAETPEENLGFGKLLLMSFSSGWIGGLAGNPADVINVRMQQDLANPPEKRRNYKHAIDGIVRMVKEEGGPKSLFRGVWPNTLRAGLMTSSQLATYDEAKAYLMKTEYFDEGVMTHFTASLISGLVATTVCSPVDVVKTRIMTSHDAQGIVHLLTEITKHEGLRWVFRGWVPSFMRLGPQTVLTFVFLEQHKNVWRWMNSTS